MEAPANIPPIIQQPQPQPRRYSQPAMFFLFVVGAILVAVISGYLGIGFPQCSFKRMTGLPCAFCGGTRSLRAIGHLHFTDAFWLNPLVTLITFVSAPAAMFWFMAPRRFDQLIIAAKKLPIVPIGLALVVLNWIFVIKFLPR
jgi:hypothetical protein